MNPVKADTEYDWIENGDFEDVSLGNLLNDYSFESGVFGDWTEDSTSYIETGNAFGGEYSLRIPANIAGGVEQNFSESVLGSAITTFTAYIYKASTGYSFVVSVYYTDASTTNIYCQKALSGYEPFQFASYINDTAHVYGIGFYRDITHGVTATLNLDTVRIGTADAEGTGQIDINSDSTPWYSYWDNFGDESFIGITSDEAYNGSYSAYLTYLNSIYKSNMAFYQRINYLAVDNITTVNFYAKTDSSSNVLIQCWLMYSDLTSEYASNAVGTFNSTDDWKSFSFSSYNAQGKLIIDIYFTIISGDYGDRTYFDDISLNATVEKTTSSRFSWYSIPTMNVSQSGFSAIALTKTNYVFYGTFYNGSGMAVDSGSFIVTSSKIAQSGTVSYGKFEFDIAERGSEYSGNDELFTITLNIDEDGIYVFKIYINWFDDWSYWDFTPPPTGQPPTNPYNSVVITVIIHLMILILPSSVFAAACYESKSIDVLFGIIAGLTLSAVLYYIVFNNIFVVIICIVVMGFLLFGKRNSSGNNE